MLEPHDAPECITRFVAHAELSDADYMLYAAGRALAFARMAADALDRSGVDWFGGQRVAEYHAYTGVSACRTAIDAAANWLRMILFPTMAASVGVDLAKPRFREKVAAVRPRTRGHLQRLGALASDIDPLRQAAQHREGLQVLHGMLHDHGRWYFPLDDPRQLRLKRVRERHDVAHELARWADAIERDVCHLLRLVPRNGRRHEALD
jgi:hypothetical protein